MIQYATTQMRLFFLTKEHPTEAFHTLLANRMLVVATNDVLDDLIAHVDTIDTFKGIKRSLSALLNIAQRHLNQPQNKFNNKQVASLLLDFFLKFVEVQKGHLLTVDDSVLLIERGEKVLLLLEGV
jgi:predicted glutamine amidotransferase